MAEVVRQTLDAAGPDGVVLFSKVYCSYCTRAKQGLKSIGIVPLVVELDERKDGREIQVALLQMTGQRTVPSAFLKGKHIGGSDDVMNGIANGLFNDVLAK